MQGYRSGRDFYQKKVFYDSKSWIKIVIIPLKWHSNSLKTIEKLDKQIDDLINAKENIDVDLVKQLFDKCKSEVSSITAKHKSIHAPISKMGKTIDKHFETGDFNPGNDLISIL